jgi:hypothetical protein
VKDAVGTLSRFYGIGIEADRTRGLGGLCWLGFCAVDHDPEISIIVYCHNPLTKSMPAKQTPNLGKWDPTPGDMEPDGNLAIGFRLKTSPELFQIHLGSIHHACQRG